jgi:NADH-quinone oxidoreductase subunit C
VADETPDAPVEPTAEGASDAEAPAPVSEAPGPPPLSDDLQALLARLQAELGDGIIEHGQAMEDLVLRVKPDSWRKAAQVCRDKLAMDYLSFISAIDWMPAPKTGGEDAEGDTSSPAQPSEMTFGVTGSAGRFQVFARVSSTSRHLGVTFKVDVEDTDPRAQSWVPVYPGADWHERECREMYGIDFEGHPAMRNLYLPSEFEGHPLRKDYPLLSREVKPWPGLVNVEGMPGEEGGEDEG